MDDEIDILRIARVRRGTERCATQMIFHPYRVSQKEKIAAKVLEDEVLKYYIEEVPTGVFFSRLSVCSPGGDQRLTDA